MARKAAKYEKSKYKYVDKMMINDNVYFRRLAMFGKGHKCYKTERDAALAADKLLIEKGKEPVNILVRK
tara:strand:+ start:8350 stop:8556 length:207 start_codon:yes stop_codon:yes gene_type:complete